MTPEKGRYQAYSRVKSRIERKGGIKEISRLDQPIFIANVNYHVGHWVAVYTAKEQGFFEEEGLTHYE